MSSSVNIQEIADNLGFELSDVEMLLNMFVEATNQSLDDLESAIQNDDYENICLHAHAIKGSAANIMLNDISTIAEHIELNANDKVAIDYASKCQELKQIVNTL